MRVRYLHRPTLRRSTIPVNGTNSNLQHAPTYCCAEPDLKSIAKVEFGIPIRMGIVFTYISPYKIFA